MITDLVSCPEPWCAYPYAMGPSGYETALGCTKFDESLMIKHPDLMTVVGDTKTPWSPPKNWRRLDRTIFEALTNDLDYVEHKHWPPVKHHNPEKYVPLELELEL